MRTHKPQQHIVSLPIRTLHPHPDNANRMSKAKFNKLTHYIKATGQYEPLIVRRHPAKENAYQILNGHHRLRVLRKLKHTCADCVVFAADDEQARLYLLNLNRLTGRDNVYRKARLIEALCRDMTPRELARHIGDSRTAIEKLAHLSQGQLLQKPAEPKPVLLPMTFFLTESQYATVSAAFEKAGNDTISSPSQKRLSALCQLAETFLNES